MERPLDKGYGSANLEWNIPNSPSTKFRLGSLIKQFTAACVLSEIAASDKWRLFAAQHFHNVEAGYAAGCGPNAR
jgi:hypothetical protein